MAIFRNFIYLLILLAIGLFFHPIFALILAFFLGFIYVQRLFPAIIIFALIVDVLESSVLLIGNAHILFYTFLSILLFTSVIFIRKKIVMYV